MIACVIRDPHWQLAGRLLDARGIDREGHTLLQENVASILANTKDAFVGELEASSDYSMAFTVKRGYHHGEVRWTRKLERELDSPYTDSQVFQHLDKLNADLQQRASELSPVPAKYYVAGSIPRGRAGANSDVDVLFEGAPAAGLGGHDVSFMDAAWLSAFGSHVEVDAKRVAADPTLLRSLYVAALEGKGYQVSFNEGMPSIKRVAAVPRVKELSPPSGMIWDFSDLPV